MRVLVPNCPLGIRPKWRHFSPGDQGATSPSNSGNETNKRLTHFDLFQAVNDFVRKLNPSTVMQALLDFTLSSGQQ